MLWSNVETGISREKRIEDYAIMRPYGIEPDAAFVVLYRKARAARPAPARPAKAVAWAAPADEVAPPAAPLAAELAPPPAEEAAEPAALAADPAALAADDAPDSALETADPAALDAAPAARLVVRVAEPAESVKVVRTPPAPPPMLVVRVAEPAESVRVVRPPAPEPLAEPEAELAPPAPAIDVVKVVTAPAKGGLARRNLFTKRQHTISSSRSHGDDTASAASWAKGSSEGTASYAIFSL